VKRRIAALLTAVTIGLGGAVAVATPAAAHTQWGCNHGSSCITTGFNGGGNRFTIVWSAWTKNVCHNLPSNFRNVGASAVSDFGSGWDMIWYQDLNCNDFWGGDRFNSPGHVNFNGPYWYLEDDVESFAIVQ